MLVMVRWNLGWNSRVASPWTVISAAVASTAVLSVVPVNAATETAYSFDFQSILYGHCRAITAKDRGRLEWATITLLVGPPDHNQLLIVNPNNQCYRKQSIESFLREKWRYRLIKRVDDLKLVKKGERVSGIECDKYTYKIRDSRFELWATKKIEATKGLEQAMCSFLAAPSGCGLPVKVNMFRKGKISRNRDGAYAWVKGDQEHKLSWLTVSKLAKVQRDSRDFVLPKDYKLATDDFSLWWSKDGTARASDIDELFTADEKKKR